MFRGPGSANVDRFHPSAIRAVPESKCGSQNHYRKHNRNASHWQSPRIVRGSPSHRLAAHRPMSSMVWRSIADSA